MPRRQRTISHGGARPEVCVTEADHRDGHSSSDSDNGERQQRHRRRHPKELHATRREVRAAAPAGLPIEDVLGRIEFDGKLPEAEQFSVLASLLDDALVDHSERWCSVFLWTGDCRHRDQCRHVHSNVRLHLWEDAGAGVPSTGLAPGQKLLPSAKRGALAPMKEMSLAALRAEQHSSHSICFLIFQGYVVWGRDMGIAGAELWGRFVHACHTDCLNSVGQVPVEGATQQKADSVSDWTAVPDVLWARIARGIPMEDIASCALANPHVAWDRVIEERWPPGDADLPERKGCPRSSPRQELIGNVAELVSLSAASRFTAQLFCWPSEGSVYGMPHSPGSTPIYSPSLPPSVLVDHRSHTCSAVMEWAAALGEPACLRFDAPICDGGLCLGSSLIVALTDGGDVHAVRHSDLKQVSMLRCREATCLDALEDHLVLGTCAPARLLIYDMTIAKPRTASCQLRLAGKSNQSNAALKVAAVRFVDKESCVCGLNPVDYNLMGEETNLHEVLVVGFIDNQLSIMSSIPVACFEPVGPTLFTVTWQGTASVLDLTNDAFDARTEKGECLFPLDVKHFGRSMLLRASSSVGYLGAAVVDDVWVHRMGSDPPREPARFSLSSSPSSSQEIEHHWSARHLHIQGQVLLVLAANRTLERHPLLEDDGEREGPSDCDRGLGGLRLFSWHLASGKQLANASRLPGHVTALAHANREGVAPFAFGGSRARTDSSSFNYAILPASGATKRRTGRSAGLQGAQRRFTHPSDVRAQQGMRKR
mmetsp:Transcript_123073/g.359308  ORF Transcript_123073/g.359308 Transcript_123073/m.359308 type:complete len:765 (-) Transcript_123073:20-2314(-)